MPGRLIYPNDNFSRNSKVECSLRKRNVTDFFWWIHDILEIVSMHFGMLNSVAKQWCRIGSQPTFKVKVSRRTLQKIPNGLMQLFSLVLKTSGPTFRLASNPAVSHFTEDCFAFFCAWKKVVCGIFALSNHVVCFVNNRRQQRTYKH